MEHNTSGQNQTRALTLDEMEILCGAGGSPVHLPPGVVSPTALTNKMNENPNGPAYVWMDS
jgi:hypothetical protein